VEAVNNTTGVVIVASQFSTTLETKVTGLTAATAYKINVYAYAGEAYFLIHTSSITTLSVSATAAVSAMLSMLSTTKSTHGATVTETVVDLTSVSDMSTIRDKIQQVLSTGTKISVVAKSAAISVTTDALVVKNQETLTVTKNENLVLDSVYLPFSTTSGSSQSVSLTLPDASTAAVTYNDTADKITYGGTSYAVGDSFILGGYRCNVTEV
jgi:hypothetical protein